MTHNNSLVLLVQDSMNSRRTLVPAWHFERLGVCSALQACHTDHAPAINVKYYIGQCVDLVCKAEHAATSM